MKLRKSEKEKKYFKNGKNEKKENEGSMQEA